MKETVGIRDAQHSLNMRMQENAFEVLGSSKTVKVDFRVISATNKSLEKMVADKSFREDLFYRINLIHLKIPPLERRRTDIPLLVDFFLENMRTLYQRPGLTIPTDVKAWLAKQDFPGNIRQLKNTVERAILLSNKDHLDKSNFQSLVNPARGHSGVIPQVGSLSLEEMEIQMIKQAMHYHNNQISQAAKSLGITRHALSRRLQKYAISYEA